MDLITSYQLLFQHQASGCDRKQENVVLTDEMLADSMLVYFKEKYRTHLLTFPCQFKVVNNERKYQEREEAKLRSKRRTGVPRVCRSHVSTPTSRRLLPRDAVSFLSGPSCSSPPVLGIVAEWWAVLSRGADVVWLVNICSGPLCYKHCIMCYTL